MIDVKRRYSIIPSDAIVIENRAYFMSSEFNGFFYSDLNTEEAHYIGSIQNEAYNKTDLYSSLQCVDNQYICLIPCTADEIAIYDVKSNKTYKIAVPSEISDDKVKFMASTVIGTDVIMFAIFKPYIYKLNVFNKSVDFLCCWKEKVDKEIVFDNNDVFFRYQTIQADGKIYIPFCNANAILVYEYDSNRCKIELIGDESNGYSGISKIENNIYCSPRKIGDRGVKWDINDHSYKYLDSSDEVEIGMIADLNPDGIKYCHAKDYQFIRSDNNLVYDKTNKTIRYYNDLANNWTTCIEMRQLNTFINNCLDKNTITAEEILTETYWMNLDVFFKCL